MRKLYVAKNVSQHPFKIRETVKVIYDSGAVLTCTNFRETKTALLFRGELSTVRPPRAMNVSVYGDRLGHIAYEFRALGHTVKHLLFTDSPRLDLKFKNLNELSEKTDLLIVAYDGTDVDEAKHQIFLASFARKVKKICFITPFDVFSTFLRPPDQILQLSQLNVQSNHYVNIWVKNLSLIETKNDIEFKPFPEGFIQPFDYIPMETAKELAIQWSQFTLRTSTNF